MTPTSGYTPETDLLEQDVERLRADLEKVKAEQLQVDQRRSELIQAVRSKIGQLQQLLLDHGVTMETSVAMTPPPPPPIAAPAPVQVRARPGRRRDETPVLEFVRRELGEVGHEVDVHALREALLHKHGVQPDRLKHLPQLLYKAASVYKEGGKIGLAVWKVQKAAMKPRLRKAKKM